VMQACGQPRAKQSGTWITGQMLKAYTQMHELGFAHSIECWQNNQLVGGLYGLAIGRVFFGESMFSRVTDASKVALVYLCQWLIENGYELIDSQIHTPHLESMGAQLIPRTEYIALLNSLIGGGREPGKWPTPDGRVSV
ncbi:MAG TPA: leucyl/phenylalanyl-tRNA--protein transferase, partial [Gammaproteobacteria bacterium]|nr:leucyl/phenylalanyl-tRNA--protein transferase [Gammaproteobacteria bacterium]